VWRPVLPYEDDLSDQVDAQSAVGRQFHNQITGKTEFVGPNADGMRCCAFCLAREEEGKEALKECPHCGEVAYCSKECQEADWFFRHEKTCSRTGLRQWREAHPCC
jgi:hypothetical protein